ncbi:MAG TPA: hypothetical protein VK569_09485, partial [Bacteroidota bacterium]|nr:hypothetical protein [Bacteroidota bacterium]
LFGSQVLDRSVVLLARLRLTDRRREAVLMAEERRAEHSDTIELAQVEGMEHTAIPSTRGQIPSEDFFSGVVEPLVIIGAVAVAIFLLFTVRS